MMVFKCCHFITCCKIWFSGRSFEHFTYSTIFITRMLLTHNSSPDKILLLESKTGNKKKVIAQKMVKREPSCGWVWSSYCMYQTSSPVCIPFSVSRVGRPGTGWVVRYHTACSTSVAWIRLWSEESEIKCQFTPEEGRRLLWWKLETYIQTPFR